MGVLRGSRVVLVVLGLSACGGTVSGGGTASGEDDGSSSSKRSSDSTPRASSPPPTGAPGSGQGGASVGAPGASGGKVAPPGGEAGEPIAPMLPNPPVRGPELPFTGGLLREPKVIEFSGEQHGTLCATAFVGDLDRDGFDDILLGDGGGSGPPASIDVGVRGAQYLFYGRASFPAQLSVLDADLVVRGGGEAAALGDIDGDGFDDAGFVSSCECGDLATGAYCACKEASGLHLLFGASDRYAGEQRADAVEASLPDPQAYGVKPAGDLDGDGFADFVVNGDSWAKLFYGGPHRRHATSSLANADASFSEAQASGWGTGDVNADGFDDLLLGSDSATRLFYGGNARLHGALNEHADATFSIPSWSWRADRFGDFDADGYADIALPDSSGIAFFYGRRARFFGTLSRDYRDFALLLASSNLDELGVGDINADGAPDMLLGDSKDQTKGFQSGALFLAAGSAERQSQDLRIGSEHAILYGDVVDEDTSLLGYCLSSGGDVNGDGYDDVLVGKPGNNVGDDQGGKVLLILGGPFEG